MVRRQAAQYKELTSQNGLEGCESTGLRPLASGQDLTLLAHKQLVSADSTELRRQSSFIVFLLHGVLCDTNTLILKLTFTYKG